MSRPDWLKRATYRHRDQQRRTEAQAPLAAVEGAASLVPAWKARKWPTTRQPIQAQLELASLECAKPAVECHCDADRDAAELSGFQFEADLLQWETDQEAEFSVETIRDAEVVCRRSHHCGRCNDVIQIGDRARNHVYKIDGELTSEYVCLSCRLKGSASSGSWTDDGGSYAGRDDDNHLHHRNGGETNDQIHDPRQIWRA